MPITTRRYTRSKPGRRELLRDIRRIASLRGGPATTLAAEELRELAVWMRFARETLRTAGKEVADADTEK